MTDREDAPLVCVRWRDARHATNAWQFLSDYQGMDCIEVMTVGWLVQDDDEAKVLAQSMAGVDDDAKELQVAGLKVIPSSAVITIDVLAETGRTVAPDDGNRDLMEAV